MKKIIYTLSLIVLMTSCDAIYKKQKEIEIKVSLLNKINYQSSFVKECDLYPVRISIVNNTDSTLSLWVMSCSWEKSFIFNSNIISFFNLGCDKDIVDLVKLKSGEVKIFNGYLRTSKELSLKKEHGLKLGFVLIRENVSFSESKFYKILGEKKLKREDVIWCSTPIK